METAKQITARQREVATGYLKEVDKHMTDIVGGRTDRMFGLDEFARMLHIHPRHMTDIVTSVTGHHPCFHFEERIVVAAKQLLADNKLNIASVAALLTYDPSNFTKFFKRYTGQTPKQFREEALHKKEEHVSL